MSAVQSTRPHSETCCAQQLWKSTKDSLQSVVFIFWSIGCNTNNKIETDGPSIIFYLLFKPFKL